MSEKTWGQVTSISPVTVRISGDSVDTPIALKNTSLTLATNDKVALDKLGGVGGWCIAYKFGPT